MQDFHVGWQYPRLKDLVVEASEALARLDAGRLEELALSCQALNRALGDGSLTRQKGNARAALRHEAMQATADLAVFGRVLEATQANLEVLRRLRELRSEPLEYRAGWSVCGDSEAQPQSRTGSGHGDN